MKSIKATKKDLNKVINWSSSKHNQYKKSEVVESILYSIEIGKDTRQVFSTGSYSERGHLGGWDYVLEIKNGFITLTERKAEEVVYHIEKQKNKKNRYHTGAKRFKVIAKKFDWHDEIIGKEFDVVGEIKDSYLFEVFCNGELRKMSINKSLVEVLY